MKQLTVLSRYGTFLALVFLCVSTSAFESLNGKKIRINHNNDAPVKDDPSTYKIGAGIWDITGPAAEVGMMGYAMPEQISHGIHFRLRARAYVIAQGTDRIVFVSTDSAMIFGGVKDAVVEKLQSLYDDLYTHDNVMLSGTHTHSGPAGFSYNLIYNLNSEGFVQQNFDTIVNGITKAIQMAHNNAVDGTIALGQGNLEKSNINRSPTAYQNNPDKIYYDSDTDKMMTLLKFVDSKSKPIGSVNWFSVHGTSMNNTNLLISGDNKGYAAYLFEKYMNGNSSLPGYGPFISAFGQTNEGDVSPNTKGPHCPDGSPCDGPTSTCPPLNRNEGCIAAGPGKDMYESAQIIGNNQFQKALELFNSASTVLRGPIAFVHTYVDFQNVTVEAQWTNSGNVEKTCHGSLGDSFAAGTTDGPGMFDFTQGTNTSDANTYWNFIASFLSDPTEEEKACQQPKPILLNTGDITFPNPWTASIMPLQIFRIGQLFIIGVPGEFTTMSGRRLRSTVLDALQDNGMGNDTIVVIAGLTNEYSHYITTWEEYQAQRYEGASTLFGPNTLAAYQQEYNKLAKAIATGSAVAPGPTPADLSGSTYSFLPGVVVDEHPDGSPFGSVKTNVKPGYSRGDSVVVEFWGANPRNNLMTQSTYLTVERNVNGQWQVVAVDGDWETKFQWTREKTAESIITITWNIPSTAVPGTYRIQTYGSSKNVFDELTPYVGTSATFSVV